MQPFGKNEVGVDRGEAERGQESRAVFPRATVSNLDKEIDYDDLQRPGPNWHSAKWIKRSSKELCGVTRSTTVSVTAALAVCAALIETCIRLSMNGKAILPC